MAAQTMHFRLSGEDFTRIVREMVLSDHPAKAYRMLQGGLLGGKPGEVESFVTKILDGTMKLIGDESCMDAVADNSKEAKAYAKLVQYIYAGRVRIDGRWWQPKTEVTAFGPDDASWATRRIPNDPIEDSIGGSKEVISQWWHQRVAFYGKEGDRVVQVMRMDKKGRRQCYEDVIIFEPVGEPPFWWNEHTTPTAALEAFFKGGRKLRKEKYSGPPPKTKEDSAAVVAEAFAEGVNTVAQQLRAEREAKYAEEDARHKALVEDIRRRVLEQARGDHFELRLPDETVLSIPRAPFVNWALGRTSLKHLAPPWECISPSGMKLPNDDPFHTDWFIGAGLEVSSSLYSGPVHDTSVHEMFELQERVGNFECGVIVDGNTVDGTVGEEIVVLPNLSPDHIEKLTTAKAIITQAGGKLAHLAVVALERSIPILYVGDALHRYPEGTRMTVYPNEGKIVCHIDRR